MKIDRRDIEPLLASGGGNYRTILLYGPDEGLVRERAKVLIGAVLGAPDDPFRLVELSQDGLLSDPALLADEAHAIAMTGGRKVLRMDGSDALGPVLAAYLSEERQAEEALLVILAGDLGARSILRKIIEPSADCAAIACYRDNSADLSSLIRKQLQEAGLTIEPAALAYAVQCLGEDRGVTRAEIDKLILYAGAEKKQILLSDVADIIGDRSAFAMDDLFFAVTDGDHKMADRFLTLNLTEQTPIMILRFLGRHLTRLHLAVARLAKGEGAGEIVSSMRPPLFWTVKARFERQMRLLTPAFFIKAMERLSETETLILRHYPMAETLLRRLIFVLSEEARRLQKRG